MAFYDLHDPGLWHTKLLGKSVLSNTMAFQQLKQIHARVRWFNNFFLLHQNPVQW